MFFEFEQKLYNAEKIKMVSWGERTPDDDEECINGYYIYIDFIDRKGLHWIYRLEEKEKFNLDVEYLRNALMNPQAKEVLRQKQNEVSMPLEKLEI
jgi:hypothetical protein